ncbi:MAG: DEAD/DEAH box helicase [Cyanobacteria bacterium MAG STY4_bin_9]|uniref:DEAD/DEAH box helicase n=1 Tax=unclassified Synechococcus TaxID=2626047 RepID=UPI000A4FF952|nr:MULTISPECIES: DEAD/DEAH box helicase [unclassified Synechococcus]MCY3848367.1 DEAD/DEAH box helicase [Cyanobacteria bacterium MAG COS4_bin_21]MDD9881139.1 DEAD/DEAH box helicase [Cyanobacteria bacterium MAG STY4_bin_9]QNI61145.1 cyanobacterial RNA helicase [Synechococcus sp. TAK9802]QNI82676.1 cyanobacterial RNA helicase [Synechococcus sp. RS9907]QNJ11741.1 cyanobacterial RNA helicase [Synechococcus sp. M16.1]
MTEQQQQRDDSACAVDLSASDLPESNTNAEVFTTTITSAEPESGFAGFGFSEALLRTLADKGYSEPSPIQKAAFPELMLGRDLVGQAQTGTGKTAAFALPLLERLESGQKTPQALVLAPTRELAMQVAESFKAYSAGHPHLKVLAVYGGTDFRSQISALRRGVDVVVGTPGRVMDHMRQGTLDTSGLRSLVLDEADEMLRMGFIDDVEWILDQLPEQRQVVLFSATMPPEIRRLSKRYLKDPAEVTIRTKDQEGKRIRQRSITVPMPHKLEALQRVLDACGGEGVIIFARTKAITLTVAETLEAGGHQVAVLNGDVPQNQRERTVERLRSGSVDILVATDVAARGLDVERIGLVINYDMPFDSEAYVHRIGRTGRAGRTGEAVLFVTPRERRFIRNLERATGQPIEAMEVPGNTAINQGRLDRLRKRLSDAAQSQRPDADEAALLQELMQRVATELELSPEQLAMAALNLAIGPDALLRKGDDDWIQNTRRNDRDRDRHSGDRRERRERPARAPEENMQRYRVEVGHRDRVKPGNLVGAIAGETGLQGRMIGRIQIFDNHSLVDLPKGMPEDVFNSLQRLRVMNRELQISKAS